MEANEMSEVLEAVKDGLKGVEDRFNAKFDDLATEVAQKLGTAPDSAMRGSKSAALPMFGNDEGVRRFASDRSLKSMSVNIALPPNTLFKAVVGDVTTGGDLVYNVAPQRDPRLANFPARRLTVFDVLPRLQASSNAFEYNALDGYTSAAAFQANEGAAKAAGTMPTELLSAPICTIAHYFKLSEQVLADAPALQAQVSNLLAYGVMAKASAEILVGSTSGKIQGLATQATGSYNLTTTASLADQIGDAVTALDVAGWRPDLVVMHPSDWFAIRSERTSTLTGEYIANGWAGPAEQGIWGMRVVTDPSVPAGQPLVLDSSQVAILDRMQTRVEFGRSGDDMTNNLITALGECRIGLVVFAPSAIVQLDN
jgi:HK97 family phage major capsid protein